MDDSIENLAKKRSALVAELSLLDQEILKKTKKTPECVEVTNNRLTTPVRLTTVQRARFSSIINSQSLSYSPVSGFH